MEILNLMVNGATHRNKLNYIKNKLKKLIKIYKKIKKLK